MKRGKRSERGRAFTLVELLVVISIIVLLMALLIPALSRAKKQAQAVVCQARLRQAATSMQVAIENNGGRFPDCNRRTSPGTSQDDGPSSMFHMLAPFAESPELAHCPLATRTTQPESISQVGGTFSAYSAVFHEGTLTGSYAENIDIGESIHERQGVLSAPYTVRGGSSVPYLLDGMWWWTTCGPFSPPPPYEGETGRTGGMSYNCINRHQGGINVLFLDFSARKVGLKELWTLKWNRWFDTASPWTKAGGVQPSDWPEWMRRFKDY